jgi:Phasin protein
MANDKTPQDTLNAQLQQGAEQMRQQVRGAIDGYFGFLRQSVASMPGGGSELADKMKTFAEKNIAATHQFLTEMSQAKDFGELMSLQSEFMHAQFKEFSENLQGLGEGFAKAAGSAPKGPRPVNTPRE